MGYLSWEIPSDPVPIFLNHFKAPKEVYALNEADKVFIRQRLPGVVHWMNKSGVTYETELRCACCGHLCRYDEHLFYMHPGGKYVWSYCPRCKLVSP